VDVVGVAGVVTESIDDANIVIKRSTIRFQMSFSGWVLRDWSQARMVISLAPRRSSTSTSTDQKHQHQFPKIKDLGRGRRPRVGKGNRKTVTTNCVLGMKIFLLHPQ
jgi:hypothetical protein